MNTLPSSIISIDISKDHLDTGAWPKAWLHRLGNDSAGIGKIVAEAKRRKAFVIFEATSTYDRQLIDALENAGLAYHRANPRKAREFAKAAGYLAKTDKVDAIMLAQYAQLIPLRTTEPVPAENKALRVLVDRRDQLATMRKQEVTRLHQVEDPAVREEMEAHIADIEARMATYEAKMKLLLKAHDDLGKVARLLASAPGVGQLTAASLLAFLPELGCRCPKAIAALVGLAPLARDSGKMRGQRRIWGGRRKIRALLFLAARHAEKNTAFADFAARLKHAGKPIKKVRIAVARKLLLALNAMVKEDRPFREAIA